jgi:RNA polymerase sigma-70 factor (ECF subfamily)
LTASPTPPRETDFLALYQGGDASAFQGLVDCYRDRIVQFFYRLCWDRDRAEDLAQDLFLKLLLGSKRYRPEGKLSTFVYRVATNLWIDHYRQSRPRPRFHSYDQAMLPDDDRPAREFDSGVATPSQLAADAEEKVALRAAIERLTEPHRLVFELAVYQQLPYGEIAELLAIPVGTVKSRMHNTVAALKGVLVGDADAAPQPQRRAGGGA